MRLILYLPISQQASYKGFSSLVEERLGLYGEFLLEGAPGTLDRGQPRHELLAEALTQLDPEIEWVEREILAAPQGYYKYLRELVGSCPICRARLHGLSYEEALKNYQTVRTASQSFINSRQATPQVTGYISKTCCGR